MQNLSPQPCQFQHLIVADLIQLAGALDNPGVRRIHAVHIGINLTIPFLKLGCQRHRGCIRTSAAQGGDVLFGVDALETRDDNHLVAPQG